jgi:leucyl-tRNA synthetase
MTGYAFKAAEKKWQKKWQDEKTYKIETPRDGKKYYVLEMLPYPSGKLHMGHVRNYTIGDIIARFKRMQGYDVLHPMEWDAFGLPAENAAFQNKQHPAKWTYANIEQMRQQLKLLGFSYDWDREFASCDVTYYKHQQQLFVEMYKAGLIYQKESFVNWDPVENSVLANEQVVDGRGWRSGAVVEKKKMRQWFMRITKYADELLQDLNKLQGCWPDKIIKMQENWIGKSQGAYVHFPVIPAKAGIQEEASCTLDPDFCQDDKFVVTVFTTRPETIFGASFIAVAANHPILDSIKDPALKKFVEECQSISTAEEVISTIEQKGYKLSLAVVHPFTGKALPIYVANFVIMDYGTGALFGCPAHDERDHEFATKYNLPIIPVIDDQDKIIDSEFLNGMTIQQGQKAVIDRLEKEGKGEGTIQFRLRDWGISRQRYWGCPVPMVHCPTCGTVPETRLPVTLPDDVTFDKPGNPLDHHPTWKDTTCPVCGEKAQRETDTLDTFVDSSWYWLRSCCPTADVSLDSAQVNLWNPVDWYIGGPEHAVMHLLYARFFVKVLRDLGYVNFDEPFTHLLTQGMVCHKTYKDADGQWIYPEDVQTAKQPVTIGRSEKMSKSKKNTVDPQEILDKYGADTTRLFVVSDTPPDKDLEWSDEGLDGCWRYTNRIHRLAGPSTLTKNDALLGIAHKYLQLITKDYEEHAFNKAIAHHRELGNAIEKHCSEKADSVSEEVRQIYLLTIAPIMPHLVAELLNTDRHTWPVFNPAYMTQQKNTIVVQVNGKKRAVFEADPAISEVDLISQATLQVQSFITGQITKTIVVPGRMVSFVV